MEDVLALYAMPYDARYPTVCLDEKPVVLHADVRPGLTPSRGRVECRDYEYERHGTANLFVLVEPLAGWRHICVTERRTKRDYAEVLRYLVEERYPEAECICVVQDNLNTHTAGALYEAFPPQQARRILSSLEFHHTPKHGSWREPCRDRDQRRRARLPLAPGRRHHDLGAAIEGAGGQAQRAAGDHRLAIHQSAGPREAQGTLSSGRI
jgi:hypothetical protein